MPKLKYIDTFKTYDHIYDNFTSKGYEYHSNILNKVLSSEMFANPANDIPFRQFERLIEHLVDAVKQIKLQYAFAYHKNSKLIN